MYYHESEADGAIFAAGGAVKRQVVGVHMHYLPEALRAAYESRLEPPMISRVGTGDTLFYNKQYGEPLPPKQDDWSSLRRTLDEHAVDVGVISINQPGVIGFSKEDASAIARDANDELIDLVRASQGRTIGLATLPWQDPPAALTEFERSSQLGLKGAMLYSNIAGEAIDADKFDPLFEAAATMGLPLLLHPILPNTVDLLIDYRVLVPAVGFLFDTTTAALRLKARGSWQGGRSSRSSSGIAAAFCPPLWGGSTVSGNACPGATR